MGKYAESLAKAGVVRGGEALQPSSRGAKPRIAPGGTSVIDGPFAEAKELVAGISIFRAPTRAEALEWARRCLQIHMRGIGAVHGEIDVSLLADREQGPCYDAVTSA